MAEAARDLGGTTHDFFPDDRGRANNLVQDNGQSFVDIFFRDCCKDLAAPTGKVKADVRLVEGSANPDLGIFDHLTGHQDLAVQQDGNLALPLGAVVDDPLEINFRALGQVTLQGKIKLFSRIPFLPLAALDGLINKFCRFHATVIGNHLEFELCGLADQPHGPIRIFYSGQLDHDFILALADDYRLGNTKLVDTVTDNFQRLGNGILVDKVDFIRG